jgi:uncharacterized membrane protein YcaP (DUF421 family)
METNDIMELIQTLFGEGTELTPWQMGARALVIFVVTIVLIRLAGRRSFGQHSTFDACTTVLLGAVLSRAVIGASPFWATVAAGAVLALMHRLVGLASVRWSYVESLINGRELTLMRQGVPDPLQMRRALVTSRDLHGALRKKLNTDDPCEAERVTLECDGDITVVRARPAPGTR